jgi:hypothetical protein
MLLTAIMLGATVVSVGAIALSSNKDDSIRPNIIIKDNNGLRLNSPNTTTINTTSKRSENNTTTTNEYREELNKEELLNGIRDIFKEQEMNEALRVLDEELAKFE